MIPQNASGGMQADVGAQPGAEMGQGYSGAMGNVQPGPGQIVMSESEFQGLTSGASMNDGKMVISEEQWKTMENGGQGMNYTNVNNVTSQSSGHMNYSSGAEYGMVDQGVV